MPNLMANMVACAEASIAEDAGLIRLALLADPDNVIASEGVLADSPGSICNELLQQSCAESGA